MASVIYFRTDHKVTSCGSQADACCKSKDSHLIKIIVWRKVQCSSKTLAVGRQLNPEKAATK